ncbi:hypothetical protein [Clostridium algidicarnis]|uniref:hypothetical protein n=1 Tax=Clostridium algidicarnis TaxID=37659 RepID=UPI003FD785C1
MTKEERKAILVIRNYLNKNLTDEFILKNYDLAIDQLIENASKLQHLKVPGVKIMSEGNQSIHFENGADAWVISSDVKALLPTPFVGMW